MAGEINGWARTLHADGQCGERNLFDVAHPIVRMIAAGVKKLNEHVQTQTLARTCNEDRYLCL